MFDSTTLDTEIYMGPTFIFLDLLSFGNFRWAMDISKNFQHKFGYFA